MTDEWRSRLMVGTLVLNSILLGMLVSLVCFAVAVLCAVLDQDFLGGSAAPAITDWVFALHSREPVAIFSLAWAVTATFLFLSLIVSTGTERPSGVALCLSGMLVFFQLAICYFLFCIAALAVSKILLIGDMGPAMEKRLQYSHLLHLPPPVIDSSIWCIAAVIYSIALLIFGIVHKRRKRRG